MSKLNKGIHYDEHVVILSGLPGEHTVLRYRAGRDFISSTWKPSELRPGAKLNQPTPLFKKLEESVIEDERARLGK